jgi:hypothetical protein
MNGKEKDGEEKSDIAPKLQTDVRVVPSSYRSYLRKPTVS